MKKVYINPTIKKGLTLESSFLTSSLSGDGLNMEIKNDGASGNAEGNQNNSFWDDEK